MVDAYGLCHSLVVALKARVNPDSWSEFIILEKIQIQVNPPRV